MCKFIYINKYFFIAFIFSFILIFQNCKSPKHEVISDQSNEEITEESLDSTHITLGVIDKINAQNFYNPYSD